VSEVDGFSTRASVRRFTVPLDEPRELALRLPVEVSGELTHVAPAEAEALRRTA
jgi:hypothetical protein